MMRETYPAGPINIERCIQLKWYILKKEVVIEYEVGPLLPYCQAVTDSDQQLQELSKREAKNNLPSCSVQFTCMCIAFNFYNCHVHISPAYLLSVSWVVLVLFLNACEGV